MATYSARLLTSSFPVSLVKGLQHLLRPHPNTCVFGEVAPLDRATWIKQKFSWPRNVFPFWSGAWMEEIVLPNHLRFRVGERWKCVPHFAGMPLVGINRIDANRSDTDAAGFEFG